MPKINIQICTTVQNSKRVASALTSKGALP